MGNSESAPSQNIKEEAQIKPSKEKPKVVNTIVSPESSNATRASHEGDRSASLSDPPSREHHESSDNWDDWDSKEQKKSSKDKKSKSKDKTITEEPKDKTEPQQEGYKQSIDKDSDHTTKLVLNEDPSTSRQDHISTPKASIMDIKHSEIIPSSSSAQKPQSYFSRGSSDGSRKRQRKRRTGTDFDIEAFRKVNSPIWAAASSAVSIASSARSKGPHLGSTSRSLLDVVVAADKPLSVATLSPRHIGGSVPSSTASGMARTLSRSSPTPSPLSRSFSHDVDNPPKRHDEGSKRSEDVSSKHDMPTMTTTDTTGFSSGLTMHREVDVSEEIQRDAPSLSGRRKASLHRRGGHQQVAHDPSVSSVLDAHDEEMIDQILGI
ncbi:hypothetical protein ADUPG1_006354 [Aduncisulcus paluster]|uniref:Uncharacterized protein n=1 Tax=Aduncisulcus paluster TaxID=2918883 RepID=A0ABQ5KJM8_9EUKA|nr:hypothetical protein ADUPG1_006354 [Aduncisulcus paluster]